jgi:hypothetical protein
VVRWLEGVAFVEDAVICRSLKPESDALSIRAGNGRDRWIVEPMPSPRRRSRSPATPRRPALGADHNKIISELRFFASELDGNGRPDLANRARKAADRVG